MALNPNASSWKPGDEQPPPPGVAGGQYPQQQQQQYHHHHHHSYSRGGGGGGRGGGSVNMNNMQPATAGGALTEAKLFVGQIPYECNQDRLRELFEAYGRVKGIHILQDGGGRGGGAGRGGGGGGGQGAAGKGRAAFITYETVEEADTAIFTLHNRYRMLTNRPLQVSYAKNSPNISPFGRQMAIEVANANHSNPMPM